MSLSVNKQLAERLLELQLSFSMENLLIFEVNSKTAANIVWAQQKLNWIFEQYSCHRPVHVQEPDCNDQMMLQIILTKMFTLNNS